MHFVMYINETKVDSIFLPAGKIHVSQLIETMRAKHMQLFKKAGIEPVFAIENLSSSINDFKSLTEDLG